MKFQKFCLLLLSLLCCAICSACNQEKNLYKDAIPLAPMSIIVHIPIEITNKSLDSPEDFYERDFYSDALPYVEVHPETVKRLNLSVESCEGLTVFGKVNTAFKTTYRLQYDEEHPEGFSITVTMPDIAYVHPNPQYPELIVALVDGEAVIFKPNGSDVLSE